MRPATSNPADTPEQGAPGTNHPQPAPDRDDDLPERLGERIEDGPAGGVASGEPDLLPNVEVPEETM